MKRVMLIGCCGAGKSTLGRSLSARTGLELIYLDQHYWRPAYQTPLPEEWAAQVAALAKQESWILDGNYTGTMDLRLARADTIIFLDRSRWLCLYRILRRTFRHYGRTRADMAAGCPERLNWPFLRYVYHYNQRQRPQILRKLAQVRGDQKVFILRSNRAINSLLSLTTLPRKKESQQQFGLRN